MLGALHVPGTTKCHPGGRDSCTRGPGAPHPTPLVPALRPVGSSGGGGTQPASGGCAPRRGAGGRGACLVPRPLPGAARCLRPPPFSRGRGRRASRQGDGGRGGSASGRCGASPLLRPPRRSPRARAGARRRGRGCMRWRGASGIGAGCIRRGGPPRPRCPLGLRRAAEGAGGPAALRKMLRTAPRLVRTICTTAAVSSGTRAAGDVGPPPRALPCPGANGGGCSSACRPARGATRGRARRGKWREGAFFRMRCVLSLPGL